ncbi:diaminopimelate epimerase [Ottowia sp. SB7-C50]|uniref:diaminopimelate epimerase n=1 Tax=Ottowia sp. SB7-C50 TaxID=3081231 RepID=UPI0029536288|nr:diaminopimelate epimerase [Ottowia sp. SB7-C50]WOP15070.1 diaminopimelate epimerase [Ottowia sp. SB7-C50]
MQIRFTKMQGAGNDFVVLDETRGRLNLSPAQYRFLGDRHFGVGADQILTVRPAPSADVDFEYVIHNGADGGEVEHCGNGSRCFVRYVRERGLTDKHSVRVKVKNGVLELTEQPDGRVRVDMGAPVFDLDRVPFDASGMTPVPLGATPDRVWQWWPLDLKRNPAVALTGTAQDAIVNVAVLSMGNPHAVQLVGDVDAAPVASVGPLIESHPAFPNRVNAGFMQIVDRGHVRLRVYERGAGETLACGTGACAAVVAGIRLGLLDERVDVQARGGRLTIEWAGGARDPVFMTGPAVTVFEGSIELPD